MISAGYLPVLVMVFSSIAIPLCILEVHILHILHLVTAIILQIIIYTALKPINGKKMALLVCMLIVRSDG